MTKPKTTNPLLSSKTIDKKTLDKAKKELIATGVHPHAELFPLQTERELLRLIEDIKKHGLKETIKTINGNIIDGRNRFICCKIAKIEPQFEEIKEEDTISYVIALNIHRRQLTTSQKAIILLKLEITI